MLWPNAGRDHLILEVAGSHTATHYNLEDSSGRVTSSSQRPVPDNTQHSQHTNMNGPRGIQNHNLSRRAAVDLHLRPRGPWDRQRKYVLLKGRSRAQLKVHANEACKNKNIQNLLNTKREECHES